MSTWAGDVTVTTVYTGVEVEAEDEDEAATEMAKLSDEKLKEFDKSPDVQVEVESIECMEDCDEDEEEEDE